MTARRCTAIASTAVAMAVAVGLATSGRAETVAPAKQTASPTVAPTTSRAAARERPTGLVQDCSSQGGGAGGGSRVFNSRRSLVVEPLAVDNAGGTLNWSEEVKGDKLRVFIRGGHRVTLELSRETRRGAGLVGFGRYPSGGLGHRYTRRVVTFIACRRGEISGPYDGWPVSFWDGFVLTASPRCVPLFIWVDDEPSPRRAVIRFGVTDCG